jgi:hypothetical protein
MVGKPNKISAWFYPGKNEEKNVLNQKKEKPLLRHDH